MKIGNNIPSSPYGRRTLLSVSTERVKADRKSISLSTPSPPVKRPLPPDPGLKWNFLT